MKYRTCFAVILIALLSSNAFASPLLRIIFRTTMDSNVGARQAGPNITFAKVNGASILFNTDPTSAVTYNNKEIQTTSLGPFSNNLLVVGTNTFSLDYHYKGATVIYGNPSVEFTLNPGTSTERLLCQAFFANGSANGYSCQKQITLTLAEIDPALSREIDQVREENRRQLQELQRLEDMRPSTDDLEQRLNTLSQMDFDDLSPDQIGGITQELAESADLIRAFQTQIETLRAQLRQELQEMRTYIATTHDVVAADLQAQGVDIQNPALFDNTPIKELTLPALNLPPFQDNTDPFDEHNNIYTSLARKTIDRFESAVAIRDFTSANLIMEAWSSTNATLGKLLENRAGEAKLAELRAFNAATASVKAVIHRLFDDKGFLKQSAVPESLRSSITQDIMPVEKERGHALRDAINTWEGSVLSPEQQLVVDTLLGIGKAYQALRHINEEVKETKQQLGSLLDDAIGVAKSVIRIGISFTPIGRFVDICEVVTGKEFCSPTGRQLSSLERSVSAIGTLIGSGQFWRQMGKVGKTAAALIQTSQKIQHFGPTRKGPLHVIRTASGTLVSDTFRSSSYIERVLKEDLVVYRVFGGTAGPVSSYWTRVKPTGPLQATLDAALDPSWGNTAAKWSRLTIPKGTTVYEGAVSEVRTAIGTLFGGGNQIYVNQRIPTTWALEQGTDFALLK